jgi:hypothetical protein
VARSRATLLVGAMASAILRSFASSDYSYTFVEELRSFVLSGILYHQGHIIIIFLAFVIGFLWLDI